MSMEIVTLTQPQRGNRVKILVGQGFNCYSYQVMDSQGPVEVLWARPDHASGRERPTSSGIPLLFPFGGRIRGTSFKYQGRTYPLEEGDGRGNAIHGFVLSRPWRVVEQSDARAVAEFQASRDDPSILKRWPADFRITADYRLEADALLLTLRVDNPDERPLPFGLATHPYFRLPPGRGGSPGDSVITLPAGDRWELADLIPTGKRLPIGELAALADGMRLGETQLDNVLSGLKFVDGRCTTGIHIPVGGATVVQTFDDSFGFAVIYTPPHREALCIEPYTTLPDAFRLEAEGIATGLRTLAPGASYETTIAIGYETKDAQK